MRESGRGGEGGGRKSVVQEAKKIIKIPYCMRPPLACIFRCAPCYAAHEMVQSGGPTGASPAAAVVGVAGMGTGGGARRPRTWAAARHCSSSCRCEHHWHGSSVPCEERRGGSKWKMTTESRGFRVRATPARSSGHPRKRLVPFLALSPALPSMPATVEGPALDLGAPLASRTVPPRAVLAVVADLAVPVIRRAQCLVPAERPRRARARDAAIMGDLSRVLLTFRGNISSLLSPL